MRRRVLFGLPLALLAFSAGCGDDPTEPTTFENPALAVGTDTTTGATVTTDKDDYAPGQTVQIVGEGWAPGETVHFNLTRDPKTSDDTDWEATADDQGAFQTSYRVVNIDLGVTFTLTATGPISGSVVRTVFTDGTVHVRASTGVTFTLTAAGQYNNETCSDTPNNDAGSSGTWNVTASSVVKQNDPSKTSLSVGNGNKSIKLAAPAFSNQGGAFRSWAATGNGDNVIVTLSPPLPSREICIVGGSGENTFTATYDPPAPTTLSVDPVSGEVGGTVTLKATLTRTSDGAGIGGQSISFKLNGVSKGTATTSSQAGSVGVATLSDVSLGSIAVGTYNAGTNSGVEATFSAANGFAGATGSNTLTVNSAGLSDLTIAKSDGDVDFTYGKNGTYALTVTNVGDKATSGTITVDDVLPSQLAFSSATGTGWTCGRPDAANEPQRVRCTSSLSLAASNGNSSISLVVTPVATGQNVQNTATVSGGGETNTANNSGSETTNIVAAPTTTTITNVTPSPVTYGQQVTVVFSVAAKNTGTGFSYSAAPTGTVRIKHGTTELCTAGAATGTCSFYPGGAGTLTLTATYDGDGNYLTSTTAGATSLTVNQAPTTTTISSVSPNPATFGQQVTVNFTVAPTNSGTYATPPSGTVHVKNGATELCSAGAAAGSCSFYPAAAGTLSLTADFDGDGNFLSSITANATTLTVNRAPTGSNITAVTSVFPVGTSIVVNGTVRVSFTVVPNPGTYGSIVPTGTVEVRNGTAVLCSESVATGSCEFSPTVAGSHSLTANYVGNRSDKSGDDNFLASSSAATSINVQYNFDGLFAPVDRPSTMNVSKAGQAIPLKWRLTDARGLPILNFTGPVNVALSSLSCATSAPLDQIEEYTGSSGLQNLGDGYYQFNWKTPTSYANSCRTIGLNLGEGSVRGPLAYFNFKK